MSIWKFNVHSCVIHNFLYTWKIFVDVMYYYYVLYVFPLCWCLFIELMCPFDTLSTFFNAGCVSFRNLLLVHFTITLIIWTSINLSINISMFFQPSWSALSYWVAPMSNYINVIIFPFPWMGWVGFGMFKYSVANYQVYTLS